ncbi:MAG: ribonuclease H-like domain-containing protein [Methanobrevibacter sp.]|jgi:uncharacterized protein YprB with RNaseH-like and TPR domain|nr:ribonuclease H-like domain-containing protein [Candidatus Methanovirga basalitermitum]
MGKEYEKNKIEILNSVLSKSNTSENPYNETINSAYFNSNSYFTNFKNELLDQYKGHALDEIEGSEFVETKYGETLKITQKEKIDFNIKKHPIKDELLCDLTLVPKIGKIRETKLNEEGYNSIPSLLEHERYFHDAKIVLNKINNNSFAKIFHLAKKSSFENSLKCLHYNDISNFKFMDIETLGLSKNVPIILIGIVEIKGKYVQSNQYFLRDKGDESAILYGFYNHLNEDSVYVTYNGASFDVPFIKSRFNYYSMDYNHNLINYDLLYYVRKLWKNKLPNCQLTTVEEHIFDIRRKNDVPGRYIPGYYETYLKEKNIGPIIPIIKHNRMDIVSLANFLMKMVNEV